MKVVGDVCLMLKTEEDVSDPAPHRPFVQVNLPTEKLDQFRLTEDQEQPI